MLLSAARMDADGHVGHDGHDVHDVHYRRARFATRLPADRLYTRSPFWIVEHGSGVWRIGLTKFASRMLGDVVDLGFEVKPGDQIALGDAVGWLEGFKAKTELYTVVTGQFGGANPDLDA